MIRLFIARPGRAGDFRLRTRRVLSLGLMMTLFAAAARAQAVARPPSPKEGTAAVQRLSWFSGCWQRRTASGLVEEAHWMAPRAGFTLGILRTVRRDSTV